MTNEMQDIRIAAAILNCPVGEIESNLSEIESFSRAASRNCASIICFPELCITGYSTKENLSRHALLLPCSVTRRLQETADEEGITILAGMAERAAGDRIYASHLVISPGKKEPSVYRKLHLAPPETALFSMGESIPVFNSNSIRFGIQLCYDAHFPELSTSMTLKGAQVIFIPHASPRGSSDKKYNSWLRHLQARAYDNSVFIVACNQNGENGYGLSFPGVAMVIGPDGEIMEKETGGKDTILYADLRKEAFERVRNHRMRFFLPNRRPELYAP